MRADTVSVSYTHLRLIAYMKPYAHWVIFALLLVLGLTAFDLYRPMLVGCLLYTSYGTWITS